MDNLWLFISLVIVHSASCQKIIPEVSELVVTLASNDDYSSLNLTCSDRESITWIFPKNSRTTYALDYHHIDGMHVLTLNVNNINYMNTGRYVCKRLSPMNENNGTEIYVYVFDGVHYLALESEYTLIQSSENKSIIIPCRPTLPSTTVKLLDEEDESEIDLKFNQKEGFFLNSAKVKDSKAVMCSALNNASETVENARIAIRIFVPEPLPKPVIDLSGSVLPVEGKPLSLNCSVQMRMGSLAYLSWKYPNEDVKTRSQEHYQEEVIHHGSKTNFILLTFHKLSKSDVGYYTCEVEDVYTNQSVNRSYYLNVFDSNESFLEFKSLSEMTKFTQRTGHPELRWIFNVTSHPPATVSCELPNGMVMNIDDPSVSSKYQFISINKLVKFSILHLEINDTGTYKFTADNKAGQKRTVNISVYIEDKPTVQLSKKNVSSFVNELSEVECFVIGYPQPKITWFAQECNNYPSSCEHKRTALSSPFTTENYQGKPHVLKSTLRYRANVTTMLSCAASNSINSDSSSIPFIVTDSKETCLKFKNLSDLASHTQKTGYPELERIFNVTSHLAARVHWYDQIIWSNILDAFIRSRENTESMKRSRSGAVTFKHYVYNNQLNLKEQKMFEILSEPEKKPNRHLSFFEGILPSLETFSDDEILQFQSGILEVIMNIKRQKQAGLNISRTLRNQRQVPFLHNQFSNHPKTSL